MIILLFIIIFLITAAITLLRIQAGFVLIVVLQMIIPPNVRIGVGSIDFQLHNTLILLLIFRFLLFLFEKKDGKTPYQKEFLKPYLILISGLFALVFFAPTLDFLTHFKNMVFTFNNGFVLSIIAFYIFYDLKQIEFFIKLIILSAIVSSLYGIYCYITLTNPYIKALGVLFPGMDALSFMEEARGGLNGRIQGTLLHPLIWAGLNLLLYFFLHPRIKNVLLKNIISVLLFANIIFSGSRSALLAFFCGLAYLFAFSGLKIKRKFILYAVSIVTIIITAIYQTPSLKKYSAFFEATVFFWDDDKAKDTDFKGSNIATRTIQLDGTLEMIDNSLLVGLGQGYIQYYQEKYGQHPLLLGFDSMVFITLINSGIIGFLLWIFFFYKLYLSDRLLPRSVHLKYRNAVLELRVFIFVFFVFIVLTGFQNSLSLFLIFSVIQFKRLTLLPINN